MGEIDGLLVAAMRFEGDLLGKGDGALEGLNVGL